MGCSIPQIAEACKDSEHLEVSKDDFQVRRKGNKALPEKGDMLKKREAKLNDKDAHKQDAKGSHAQEEAKEERDERGHLVLCQQDFENP